MPADTLFDSNDGSHSFAAMRRLAIFFSHSRLRIHDTKQDRSTPAPNILSPHRIQYFESEFAIACCAIFNSRRLSNDPATPSAHFRRAILSVLRRRCQPRGID